MQIFAEYVHPFTAWLSDNPNWALLITFLISFSESLAIVGSIVPGSVTMTAIGILAGSGVMRIDLTILSAILGAIAGDGASYWLGYFYSDRLIQMWPFRKYPRWLGYGKEYFAKHGGKSVLIGRFIGPLRSIIPVVAGMVKMRKDKFIIANVLSAIGWSILYVLPGIFIGAASTELSNESATKLFTSVLLVLLAFWLLGIALKWLVINCKIFLDKHFHSLWSFGKRHPRFQAVFLWVTPPYEKDNAQTCYLIFNILLMILILIVLNLLRSSQLLISFDQGISYFFFSLHSKIFDLFFITVALVTSFYITIYFYIIVAVGILLYQQSRTLCYWLILPILTLLTSCQNIFQPALNSAFHINACLQQSWIASLLCAVLFFINYGYKQFHAGLIVFVFLMVIGLSTLSNLYFIHLSLTASLIATLKGVLVASILWLFYRRKKVSGNTNVKTWAWFYALISLLFAISFCIIQYPLFKKKHMLKQKTINITKQQWWDQSGFKLPEIRRNRWGTPVSYINFQINGNLALFHSQLLSKGWKEVDRGVLQALLERLKTPEKEHMMLPLLPQLYNAQPAKLLMTKRVKGDLFVLRLWCFPARISSDGTYIHIGSIHQSYIEQKRRYVSEQSPINILKIDLSQQFQIKTIQILKQDQPSLVSMPREGVLIQL